METAIKIYRVSKRFRRPPPLFAPWRGAKTIQALSKVDWEIPKGSVTALVGPNGAGKTTLLKILATLVLPDEGEVWVNGFSLSRDPNRIRQSVSLALGEERSFYWRLTARQNLEFFAALYDLSSQETRKKIDELAQTLDFRSSLDRIYQELSSGLRQRLVLARSFLNGASVLLVDEPTRSLDPLAKIELRRLLRQFSREWGKTILFTTHDLREAQTTADRIAILHQGRLVQTQTHSGPLEELPSLKLETLFAELCRSKGPGT